MLPCEFRLRYPGTTSGKNHDHHRTVEGAVWLSDQMNSHLVMVYAKESIL